MFTINLSESNAIVIMNALKMASKDNDVAIGVCKPIYDALAEALIPKEEGTDGDKRDDNI